MKKKIIISVIILAAITSISFLPESQPFESTDIINVSDFDMSPTGAGYSSINTSLLVESTFVTKFGAPAGNTTEYSEMEETNVNHYVYTGAEAWFMDDKLQALVFTSPDYNLVMSNGSSIKVGDSISTVANMFPSSWAGRTSNQVFIGLENSLGPIDMTIMFEFDQNTDLITTISIQQ